MKKRLHACFLINRNVGTFRLVIQEQDKVDAHECTTRLHYWTYVL